MNYELNDEALLEGGRPHRYAGARHGSFSSSGSLNSEIYEEIIGSERVTIEQAFENVGGFGKFQKFSAIMNTLANMGAALIIYSFAFMEKEPVF